MAQTAHPTPPMPRLFISHSHHDDAFGLRLVADLQARLGTEAVWYDSSGGLHGGDEWWNRIVAEITARDTFLVLLSPEALASDWVPREMGIAYWQHVTLGKRLLPLLYRACEPSADWQLIQALPVGDADEATYARSLAAVLRELGVVDAPVSPHSGTRSVGQALAPATPTDPDCQASQLEALAGSGRQPEALAHAERLTARADSPPALWLARARLAITSDGPWAARTTYEGAQHLSVPQETQRALLALMREVLSPGILLHTLKGHTSGVLSVAWSPDGRHLASASDDTTVRVWEASSGRLLWPLRGHKSYVGSVVWSPGGEWLASASADKTVRVWEASTGQLLRTPKRHTSEVLSVAWSPDGRQLASASDDTTVRVWEASSGRLLWPLRGHTDYVRSVAWSPDGQQLASASDDTTVRVWEASSGRLLWTLQGHKSYVGSVVWSPGGEWLASASADKTVRVWEASSGRPLRTLQGHIGSVYSVGWSPDGQRLASAGRDQMVRVWEASAKWLSLTLQGHTSYVRSIGWAPDGRRLASAGWDKLVRVWEASSGRLLQTLQGHTNTVESVAWSPDGGRLASASTDQTVRVWYVRQGDGEG